METLYFSHDLPPAALVRGVRGAFVHDLGGAVDERRVGDVGVAGDPADVGRAPVDVRFRVQVEHGLVGVGGLGEVAAGGVQDALGLAGGAGGVEDEQRVLGVVAHGGVLGGGRPDGVGPPVVPALVPVHVLAVALDHHDVLHGVPVAVSLAGQGVVDRGLQGAGLAAAVGAVGGDHELGLGVLDPGAQRVGGEAAEHHRVHGADPGAGQQRDHGLGDHGQVDGHAVALGHAEGLERVRGLLHLLGQLRVGVGAGVAGFALEVDGHPVAEPVLHVPVQRVVRGVDLAADEPLRERRVGPVQGLREVLVPGQQLAGLLRPESGAVGVGLGVIVRADHGVRGEVLRGGKLAVLMQQVFKSVALLAWRLAAVAVEPGVSWDMVNLIIHRSLLRGRPVTWPSPARAAAASGHGRSRTYRKELFRNTALMLPGVRSVSASHSEQ